MSFSQFDQFNMTYFQELVPEPYFSFISFCNCFDHLNISCGIDGPLIAYSFKTLIEQFRLIFDFIQDGFYCRGCPS
jgi:hypothetical protein